MRFEFACTSEDGLGKLRALRLLSLSGIAISDSPGLMDGRNPGPIAAPRSSQMTVSQTRRRISASQKEILLCDDEIRCGTNSMESKTDYECLCPTEEVTCYPSGVEERIWHWGRVS